MGLLDNLFGGSQQSGGRGGASPLTLGLLALLAYRTYQGKGRLADMLGHGQADAAGRTAGPGRLPEGNPVGPTGADGGGLGSILGNLLRGGPAAGTGGVPAGPGGGGLGDLLRGGLNGVLGGAAAGSLLNGGLGDLVRRFQQNGYGDAANSWVGHGANQAIDPQQLEHAVGRDTLQQLSNETGRPYLDVLSELSTSLPETVDKLTPEGRLPTEEEAGRWV